MRNIIDKIGWVIISLAVLYIGGHFVTAMLKQHI